MSLTFEQIAVLSSTATEEETKYAAGELEISFATAKQIHQVWDRRIRSRCVQCNFILKGERQCERCGATDDPNKVTEFLSALPPTTIVTSRVCECGARKNWTAEQVLGIRSRIGFLNPHYTCYDCELNNRVEEDRREGKKKGGEEVEVKELGRPKKSKKRQIKPVESPAPMFAEEGFVNTDLQEKLEALQAAQK